MILRAISNKAGFLSSKIRTGVVVENTGKKDAEPVSIYPDGLYNQGQQNKYCIVFNLCYFIPEYDKGRKMHGRRPARAINQDTGAFPASTE